MKHKRITAILLSALLTCSAVSIPASAQTAETADTPDSGAVIQKSEQKSVPNASGDGDVQLFNGFEYTYDLSKDQVTITGYKGNNADVVVPAMINDSDVVNIAPEAFKDCEVITSITLPDTIKYIGYNAFEGCVNLAAANLPDSVKSIGEYAFSGCIKLASFHYPKKWSVTNSYWSDDNSNGGIFQGC